MTFNFILVASEIVAAVAMLAVVLIANSHKTALGYRLTLGRLEIHLWKRPKHPHEPPVTVRPSPQVPGASLPPTP